MSTDIFTDMSTDSCIKDIIMNTDVGIPQTVLFTVTIRLYLQCFLQYVDSAVSQM